MQTAPTERRPPKNERPIHEPALARLRGITAEVERVAAFGWEIDLRHEARLAQRRGPVFPTFGAARGGDAFVLREFGVGFESRIPDMPARRGSNAQSRAIHPFDQQWSVHRHV